MLQWLTLAVSCEAFLPVLTTNYGMYDCYDTKCRGEGLHNYTFIQCDNYHNYCNATDTGELKVVI